MRASIQNLLVAAALALGCTWANATPTVPDPLRPWAGWAAEPYAFRECALTPGSQGKERSDYVCAWAGKLSLSLSDTQGSFEQSWTMDEEGAVFLPGSETAWPQSVLVDGQKAAVVAIQSRPSVRLTKGAHRVQGQWAWEHLGSSLAIPSQTAWWEVSINGKPTFVRRQDNALLFEAAASATPSAQRDTLTVRVFAKWQDGQVPQEDILVQLTAGGAPREVILGPVADPSRFAPIGLSGPWAAKWEPDGRLRVQLQPGSAALHVLLRCIAKCDAPFAKPKTQAPWPQTEFWALQGDPAFRVVAWNAPGVDPRQIGAPNEWAQLPWVVVSSGQAVGWSVKARGPSDKDASLTLDRTAWLDFDGQGWWVMDTVAGKMPRSGRIEALAPYQMHAASMDGSPVLVSTQQGRTGSEVRTPQGQLRAVLRQEGVSPTLPIAGEKGEFSQVSWQLHLPKGYKVLFAPGADSASNVWWNRWTLTQVLSVALILLLAWRWGGWRTALPAAGLLLLSFHIPGFPRWSWGFVLALGLLSKATLPEKLARIVSILWKVVLVFWFLLAASFAIDQVRGALYPQWATNNSRVLQLPAGDQYRARQALQGEEMTMEKGTAVATMSAADASAPAMPVMAPQEAPMPSPASPVVEDPFQEQSVRMPTKNFDVLGLASSSSSRIEDTGTKIAAGPGLPTWQSYEPVVLQWQGPITPKDTVKLWVASPSLVILGRWLSVVLMGLMGWMLLKRPPHKPLAWRFGRNKVLLASLLLLSPQAFAVAPPVAPPQPAPDVLARLGEQLHPVPKCAPSCTSLAKVSLQGQAKQLTVEMEVHAQAKAALILPSPTDQTLVLVGVLQEGVALPAVMQQGQDTWVEVQQGVAHLQLVFEARSDTGALRFSQAPGHIEVNDAGWSFTGIERGVLPSGVLGWQRAKAPVAQAGEPEDREVFTASPFVRIDRTLVLGPKWEVYTRISRIAPTQSAFVIPVALAPNEKPQTDLPRDKQGRVLVSFQEGQDQVEWMGDVPSSTSLVLTPADPTTAIEVWSVQAGPRFHVEAKGVVPRADNSWTFQPLPGESLVLAISEPKAVEGALVAIDQMNVSQQWGPRGQTISMAFTTRATTATDLVLTVPKDLELVSVIQQAVVPGVKVENGKLALPVPPGTQSWQIEFRSSQPPAWSVSSPAFAINAPLANLTLSHAPGDKRWILAVFGPGKGPAVAYWPWLIVLLGLAWFAGKWQYSPLSRTQWVLLGLGFSVAAPWKIAIVGGWLVAMHLRQRFAENLHTKPVFNLVQAILVAWTLFAVMVMVAALPESLLASPDMRILGGSSHQLPWFVDQVKQGALWPQATVLSLPLGVYRALMLAWALWLALSAVKWLREALRAWLAGGHWHARHKRMIEVPAKQPDSGTTSD